MDERTAVWNIPYSGFCFLTKKKKKIRPVHYKVSGALKTDSFLTAARFLQGRSYAAGGTRYLLPDLMLLTHAGCAFKDPRGRFGISNTLPGAVRGPRRARE